MKLKVFEIQSYRSCKKTRLNFNKKLTGLIGVNGAGKSNILSAMLLLKKLIRHRLRPVYHESGVSYNDCLVRVELEHNRNSIYIEGSITYGTDDNNIDEIVSAELKWRFSHLRKGEWISIPIDYFSVKKFPVHRYLYHYGYRNTRRKTGSSRRSKNLYFDNLRSSEQKEQIIALLSKVAVFFDGMSYYGASQFSNPARCPVSIELEESRLSLSYSANEEHEQYIYDLYRSYRKNSKEYKRYINTVGNSGIGLVDDILFDAIEVPSSTVEVRSGAKVRRIKRKRLLVIPIFKIGREKLSPNQLSEGTFKTLALLFYILTDRSSLLLIEEPEVCIHHGLLNSVLHLIRLQSKVKQIVISTHSDYVLDYLDPEDLLLIKNYPQKGTVALSLSETMSKSNYNALKNYLTTAGNLGEFWREGGFDNE